MRSPFFTTLFLAFAFSCSDDPEEPATLQDNEATAIVNGQAFAPDETKATDNGQGLEIKLKGDDQEITLYLDDKVAGSYTTKNTLSGGRVASSFTVIAEFVDKAGIVFYAISGDLKLTIGSDGSISGTFSFEAKSTTGTNSSITGGKFGGLPVGNLSSLGCLLAEYADGVYSTKFFYDSQGNLVKTYSTGDYNRITIFSYAKGRLVRTYAETPDYTEESSFKYNSNEMISQRTTWSSSSPTIYIEDYSYNANGKLVKLIETEQGNSDYEGSGTITYSGSNVIRYENENEVITFSNFDNKLSIGTILLKALKNQPALVEHILWAPDLSENNPGREERIYYGNQEPSTIITYEYNSTGYPQKITFIYDGGTTEVATLTYSGCN